MRKRTFGYLLNVSAAIGAVLAILLRLAGFDLPLLELLPGIAALVLALILVRRIPENRMALVVSLIAVAGVNLYVVPAVSDWSMSKDRDVLAVAATQLGNTVWLLLFLALFVFLPLWFPTGNAIGRRWEWVWRVSVAAVTLAAIGSFFADRTCVVIPDNVTCLRYLDTPWGISGISEDMFNPLFAVGMLMTVPAVISLVLRFRRAFGAERLQLRWLIVSLVLLVLAWAVHLTINELFELEAPAITAVTLLLLPLTGTAVVISIGMAILRYRLYDIDRIVSRTVSYTVVVGLLGLVVAGVAAVAGAQFETPWVVAATTLGVAALFNPLRKRIQRLVDRRFNRNRSDVERVMDRFAGSLRDEVHADGVVDGWVEVVSATMQPSSIAVWLRKVP